MKTIETIALPPIPRDLIVQARDYIPLVHVTGGWYPEGEPFQALAAFVVKAAMQIDPSLLPKSSKKPRHKKVPK